MILHQPSYYTSKQQKTETNKQSRTRTQLSDKKQKNKAHLNQRGVSVRLTRHEFLRRPEQVRGGEVEEHGQGDAGVSNGLEQGPDGEYHLLV